MISLVSPFLLSPLKERDVDERPGPALVTSTVGRVGVDISPLGVISVEIGVISNHHS
jgi:hypothetical protein